MSSSPWSRATPFLLRGFLRLLALTAPFLVVFAVINVFGERRVSWLDRRSAELTEGATGLGTPRPGTSVEVEGYTRYVIDNASLWPWAVSLLPALFLSLAVSTVAVLLLRMMTETYSGRPFSEGGARRLRRVAAVVGVAAVVVPLLESVSGHVVVSRVLPTQSPGVIAGWDVLGATLPWLLVSLLVLAVAEAFGIGARLAHDVDGLV